MSRSNASIDQLITYAADSDVSFVAKVCIGYVIGHAESRISLPNIYNSWLFSFLREYLARARTIAEARTSLNELSFVVFNYDRIVEAVIWSFVLSRFELSPVEALTFVQGMQIDHPYGQLAKFAVVPADGLTVGHPDFESLFEGLAPDIAAAIRTFDESVDENLPQRVRGAIDQSKNIVFVGFGFGAENLDLILPPDNRGAAKNLYTTTFGINQDRWKSLEAAVLSRLTMSENPNKQSALSQIYGPGRFSTSEDCPQLVDHFSLQW
jgi:hypothetical protein